MARFFILAAYDENTLGRVVSITVSVDHITWLQERSADSVVMCMSDGRQFIVPHTTILSLTETLNGKADGDCR